MVEENLEESDNNAMDDEEAAFVIANMKYLVLDNKTANELSKMKKAVLDSFGVDPDGQNTTQYQETTVNGDVRMDHEHGFDGYLPVRTTFIEGIKNGLELKLPLFGQAIDGLTLPKVPPVKKLQGLIGICSVPFEKQLTESDVRDDLSRISIPKAIVEEFMKPLMNAEEDLVSGISVTTYDSKGNEYPMRFKTWASKIHVLTEGWTGFCHAAELKAHQDWVTIWMFRHNQTQKLCFVVMARRLPIFELIKRKKMYRGRWIGY